MPPSKNKIIFRSSTKIVKNALENQFNFLAIFRILYWFFITGLLDLTIFTQTYFEHISTSEQSADTYKLILVTNIMV